MRAQWRTRTGFILAAAGSAVGLGNIWRFPNMVAEGGGGAFLLMYLLFVAVIGVPLLMSEVTLGRLGRANNIHTFSKHFNSGGKFWGALGILPLLAALGIVVFYYVIAGWSLNFSWQYLINLGDSNFKPDFVQTITGNGTAYGIWTPVIWGGIFCAICLGIVMLGVNRGLETANKVLMPMLFLIIVIMVVRALTINTGEGSAMDGLVYYLKPDFSKITGRNVADAMGQAFFSLSLASAAILIYGSYLDDGANIPKSAATIAGMDTLIAVLAGFFTLPFVFAFGLENTACDIDGAVQTIKGTAACIAQGGTVVSSSVDGGGGLAFIVLADAFKDMPKIFGFLFFFLLTIAAITSYISLAEPLTAWINETFKISRQIAAVMVIAVAFSLGIPVSHSVAKGTNVKWPWQDKPTDLIDVVDGFVTQLAIPIGAFCLSIFCCWVIWGKIKAEIQKGSNASNAFVNLLRLFAGILCPVVIGFVLLVGIKVIEL